MLWWLFSGFFFWLGLREIYYHFVPRKGFERSKHISKKYVLVTFMISLAFAYTPLRDWQFERFLAEKAAILSERDHVSINCKGALSTAFGQGQFFAGYAEIEKGRISFQYPWCDRFRDYLQNPEKNTNDNSFYAVLIFTHESMHLRGERDEAKTECQAIQRYVRAARLLGVYSPTAKKDIMRYYTEDYPRRASGMFSMYHSAECAPGKALDEKLPDSTWN